MVWIFNSERTERERWRWCDREIKRAYRVWRGREKRTHEEGPFEEELDLAPENALLKLLIPSSPITQIHQYHWFTMTVFFHILHFEETHSATCPPLYHYNPNSPFLFNHLQYSYIYLHVNICYKFDCTGSSQNKLKLKGVIYLYYIEYKSFDFYNIRLNISNMYLKMLLTIIAWFYLKAN